MSSIGPRELQRRRVDLGRRLGVQIRADREEGAIAQAQLAHCAGMSQGMLSKIESGSAIPGLELLLAISACLGADLGVRFFPVAAPRIRDRFQAPMVEALVALLGPAWRARPEFVVRSARGVIDLVLSRELDRLTVACECHSELRRLELVLRRANEKAEALVGQGVADGPVSSMLLLRSTRATREIARTFEGTLAAAYPARTSDAMAALSGIAAWPGPAIIWAAVEGGRATILDGPPRGVRVGR